VLPLSGGGLVHGMQSVLGVVRGEHARVHANSWRHCGCTRIRSDNWRFPGTQSMCAWPLVDCHTRNGIRAGHGLHSEHSPECWKGSVPRATLVSFVHVCFRNIFCTAQCGSRGRTGWRVFLEAGQVKNHQSHHGRSVHGRSASPCPSFPRAPSRVHTKQQQLLLGRAFVPASYQVSRVCLMGVCVWSAITRATVMRSCERLMVLRLWDSIRVTPYPPTLCTTRVWPWFFRRSS
jgi:hypothetical protein